MRQATLAFSRPQASRVDQEPQINTTVASSWSPNPPASVPAPAPTSRSVHPLFLSKPTDAPCRPQRSARSKAPPSYKEDLQAVLRADAVIEKGQLKPDPSHAKGKRKAKPIAPSNQETDFQVISSKPASLSLVAKGTIPNGGSSNAHPFFAKKEKPKPAERVADGAPPKWSLFSQKASSRSVAKIKVSVEAPWPLAEMLHVRGWTEEEAAILARRNLSLSRKGKERAVESPTESAFVHTLLSSATETELRQPTPHTGGYEHIDLSHIKLHDGQLPGAFLRLMLSSASPDPTSSQSLWTHAYRPLNAAECLSNSEEANYLLHWLKELQVKPPNVVSKRRKTAVQRKIEKKRKRNESDDDEEMGDFIVDEEEEACLSGKTFDIAIPVQLKFSAASRLTNCIVLTGPTGSGKTATIYACASQLNYEVFELYPGMGKRSGKELLSSVGDLGRNHMVSSGGTGGGAFRHKQNQDHASVRQSLILVEEADLLFEEDKGFWSAVVELIGESKRPVVITCNDLEMIPLGELPVQEVLRFEGPEWKTAVPYLQLLGAVKGRRLEREDVERILPSEEEEDGSPKDGALFPNEVQRGRVDLRKAINQLQLGLLAPPISAAKEEGQKTLKELAREADLCSFADTWPSQDAFAYGQPGVERQPQLQVAPHMRQLISQPLDSTSFCSPLLDAPQLPPSYNSDRLLHSLNIETMLSMLHIDPSSRLPRSAGILDYAPYIRLMNLIDDEEQACIARLSSRSTRNSSYFVRWLPFGPLERQACTASSFPVD